MKLIDLGLILTLSLLTICLSYAATGLVQVDMPSEVKDGDRKFITTDNIYRDYNQPGDDIEENTTGFVNDYKGKIPVRNVYIEDERSLVQVYETCWHEQMHLKLSGTTAFEHSIIWDVPWWKRVNVQCGKWMVTNMGFEGVKIP